MNEEFSCRPEFEYRDEYPAPPEEFGAKSKGIKSKKKKLAQLMLYSWVTLMLGGGVLAAESQTDAQCTVTVYDTAGGVVFDETVPESGLAALVIPNGAYRLSDSDNTVIITDGRLTDDFSSAIPESDDGVKHIDLYPSE